MADYTSDRTGANIDTVLDNADASNIGKSTAVDISNVNTITKTGFYPVANAATGQPTGDTGHVIHNVTSGTTGSLRFSQLYISKNGGGRIFNRINDGGTWVAWQELYHTGNTSVVVFGGGVLNGSSGEKISLGNSNNGVIQTSRGSATNSAQIEFFNPNGQVGGIVTNGTATSYNTSSDPRLKDFKAAPTDAEVNAKFDDLFGCFKTFNWKSDVGGELVWGFDAHATIDAGLDMGSEGEGSRDLALGDVYDTTPAELDDDGVEIKAAIEHKVSPAGVDQSKAVAPMLAMMALQKRQIEDLTKRIEVLEF